MAENKYLNQHQKRELTYRKRIEAEARELGLQIEDCTGVYNSERFLDACVLLLEAQQALVGHSDGYCTSRSPNFGIVLVTRRIGSPL